MADKFENYLKNEKSEYKTIALTSNSYRNIEHSLNDNAINNNLATYGDALLKLALCDILFNEKVENITVEKEKYESDEVEKFYTDIKSTEFIWQKKDDGKQYQFEMEELRDVEAPTLEKNTYACRYLHALYDFNNKEFNHFDGAIRCYDLDSMIKRIDTTMDKMGHQACYTKIFRIDGHISLDLWKALITQYLCSNNSVYDYFGIPRPFPNRKKNYAKRHSKIMYHIR